MCIPKTKSKRKLQVLSPRPKASALWLWQGRTLASGLTLTHVLGPFLKRVPFPALPEENPYPLCRGQAGGGVVGKETQNLASNASSLQKRSVGTGWGWHMRTQTPRSSSYYFSQDQGLKTLRQAGVAEALEKVLSAGSKPQITQG